MPTAKPKLTPRAAPKVIAIKPITSWSYSRYSDYKECPLKFKLKHIDRIKEPPSAAMEKGIAVHKMAEDYIKGVACIDLDGKKLKLGQCPGELTGLKDELDRLKKLYKRKTLPMIIEDQWGFDSNWSEAAWDDWTGCWLRVKLDEAHYEVVEGVHYLYIRDWKTGKMSPYKNAEYMEQLELYALVALIMSVQENVIVVPEIGWTETGEFYPAEHERVTYSREDVPRLKAEWEKRVRPMFNDKTFPPKPNHSCKWCYFSVNGKNKGPCKF
jgi:CRISPR/Cas system-associated exonuclease Cas4 (RecB family)